MKVQYVAVSENSVHNSCVPCTVIWTWRFVRYPCCVSVSTAQCRAHTHLYITLQRTCVTCPTTAIFTHSGRASVVQKLRVTSMYRSHLRRPRLEIVFFLHMFVYLHEHTNTSCVSKFSHAPDFVQTWEQRIALLRGISHLSCVRVHDVTAGPIF